MLKNNSPLAREIKKFTLPYCRLTARAVSSALSVAAVSLIFCAAARAEIDIARIIRIESSGNPRAVSSTGCRGLMQISVIALDDYNQFHVAKYNFDEMFNAEKNVIVGTWMIEKRIPQMLRHFGKPVTDRNILISNNAGIDYVVRGRTLPAETVGYLKKYGVK